MIPDTTAIAFEATPRSTGATSMSASTERSRTAPSWSQQGQDRDRDRSQQGQLSGTARSPRTRVERPGAFGRPAVARPNAACGGGMGGTLAACSPTSARSLVASCPHSIPPLAYALAIDLGTGGPKVALVAADGHIAAHGFATVDLLLGEGGAAEQRPAECGRDLPLGPPGDGRRRRRTRERRRCRLHRPVVGDRGGRADGAAGLRRADLARLSWRVRMCAPCSAAPSRRWATTSPSWPAGCG